LEVIPAVVDISLTKLDHFPLDTLLASFPIAAAHTFRFSHTDLFTLVSIALRVRALHLARAVLASITVWFTAVVDPLPEWRAPHIHNCWSPLETVSVMHTFSRHLIYRRHDRNTTTATPQQSCRTGRKAII
jgi:hypothetical protein